MPDEGPTLAFVDYRANPAAGQSGDPFYRPGDYSHADDVPSTRLPPQPDFGPRDYALNSLDAPANRMTGENPELDFGHTSFDPHGGAWS